MQETNTIGRKPIYNRYRCISHTVDFSLVIKNRDFYAADDLITSCREVFIDIFIKHFGVDEINTDRKINLLVTIKREDLISDNVENTCIKKAEASLELINFIENYIKFDPTDVIRVSNFIDVGYLYKAQNHQSFIFRMSNEWFRAPQLISLALLLIKFCLCKKYDVDKFKPDASKILTDPKEYIKSTNIQHYISSSVDFNKYFENCVLHKNFRLFLDNIQRLFFSDEYDIEKVFGTASEGDGINSLLEYDLSYADGIEATWIGILNENR